MLPHARKLAKSVERNPAQFGLLTVEARSCVRVHCADYNERARPPLIAGISDKGGQESALHNH
jgi:hypothetical protein